MVIKGTGKVGIGADAPDELLTIKSSANPKLHIQNGAEDDAGIKLSDVDAIATQHFEMLFNSSTGDLRFKSDSEDNILYLDNAGNVGIGTNSPNHLLHVGDDANATFVTTPDKAIQLSSTTNDEEIAYILYAADGTNNIRSKYYIDDNTKYVGWDSTYSSGLFGYEWKIANTQKMKLDTSGNLTLSGAITLDGDVFIPSGNALQLASVADHTKIERSTGLQFYTNSAPRLNILDSGNVGIGTTSPNAKLQVEGSDHTQLQIKSTDGTKVPYLSLNNTDMNWHLRCDGGIGDKFIIRDNTNSANRLTIDTTGNVGIGTTSPSAELHISTASPYPSLLLESTGNTANIMRYTTSDTNWTVGIDYDDNYSIANGANITSARVLTILKSNGNVGIGTTSPSVKLDVEESSVSALIDIHQSASGTGTDSGIRFQKNSNLKGTVGYNAGTDTVNLNYGAFDNTHLNIDSSGNVGIGTASPAVNLHVKDDSGSNTLEPLRVENSNGYAELGAQSTYVRLLAGGSLTYAANSSASYFYIGGLGKMGLTSTGLGIGNTSPSEALDVSGNANVSGTIASGSHITASGNQDTTVTAQATGTAGAATRTGTFALLNDNAAWNLQIAGGTSASAGFFEIRDNITQLLKIDRQDYGGDVHVIKDLSVEGDNGIIAGAVVWERFPFIVSSGVAGRYYYRDVDDGVNSFALWDDYDTDPTGFSYLDVPGQYVVPEDCTLKAMSAVVTNFTSTTSVTLSIYHGEPELNTTTDTTLALAGATTVPITTARRVYSASATYDVDLEAGDIIVPTVSHANAGASQTMRGNITLKFITR